MKYLRYFKINESLDYTQIEEDIKDIFIDIEFYFINIEIKNEIINIHLKFNKIIDTESLKESLIHVKEYLKNIGFDTQNNFYNILYIHYGVKHNVTFNKFISELNKEHLDDINFIRISFGD